MTTFVPNIKNFAFTDRASKEETNANGNEEKSEQNTTGTRNLRKQLRINPNNFRSSQEDGDPPNLFLKSPWSSNPPRPPSYSAASIDVRLVSQILEGNELSSIAGRNMISLVLAHLVQLYSRIREIRANEKPGDPPQETEIENVQSSLNTLIAEMAARNNRFESLYSEV
jgi:hypothetical protein